MKETAMRKAFLFTCAYNAESTIRRCLDSVLCQSFTDFNYHIVDHGSTDNTAEILAEYARKDPRISTERIEQNVGGITVSHAAKMADRNTAGYFSTLDADDEYAPDFLEKMLAFAIDNSLDVACCGTDWTDKRNGNFIKRIVQDKHIILEGKDFAEYFPVYRNYMANVWGAVYSLELLRGCSFEWVKKAPDFHDTAFVMETFRRAKRAGIFAEGLHKYYVSSDPHPHKFNPDWFKACKYLDKISREYLLDYGPISRNNEHFLYVQLLILIKYVLPRIQNADAGLGEKLKLLSEIFNDGETQHMLKQWSELGIYSDRGEFLQEIKEWIISQDRWKDHQVTAEAIFSNIDKHNHGKESSIGIFDDEVERK